MEIVGLDNHYKGTSVLEIEPGKTRGRWVQKDPSEKEEDGIKKLMFKRFKVAGSAYYYKSWERDYFVRAAGLKNDNKIYRWGDIITFGTTGNSQQFQGENWGRSNIVLTTAINNASLVIPINTSQIPPQIIMEIELGVIYKATIPQRQVIQVRINGQEAGNRVINKIGTHKLELEIPVNLLKRSDKLELSFSVSHKELGELRGDGRRDVLFFKSLRLRGS
jgi:hypothetical protein